MDLDANCSTLGANGALAEIVAKHAPEAYIGLAAHAVPPNLSQISGFLLFVAARSWARCLSVPFVSKILTTGPFCVSAYVYSDLAHIMFGVAGGNCKINCHCNRYRGTQQ